MLAVLLLAQLLGSPVGVTPLEGETHHVQGIAIAGERLLVTSVDRAVRKGFLAEFELATGRRIRGVEIQKGDLFHPGGIAVEGGAVWIPVAEYRRGGRSVIQRRALADFSLLSEFPVDDHIGCLAARHDLLMGCNWDARTIYDWSPDGKLIRSRPNPTALRVQDWKFDERGMLVASGLTEDGGEIRWLDPDNLETRQVLRVGRTDRHVVYTHEGMEVRPGQIYLLPEDAPSRLFRFELKAPGAPGR